jgi:dihydroorotase
MILIKDGRVIDPKRGVDDILDVVIDKGKVKKIGKYQRSEEYDEIIEAKGMIVAPGLVDIHVHFRDPGLTYKEDIHTGAAAAAAGGFTSVVCMANTKPVVDNVETLKYVIEEGKKTGIHVYSCANVTKGMKGQELTDMDALKAAGAVGFTDDGVPLMDEKLLMEAFLKVKELDVPISLHEEDPAFIENNGVNRGEVSKQLGIGGSCKLAEDSLVARDCMLALYSGAKVNIQHISSGNAVGLIRHAKERGANVRAEVTPHHLALDEKAVLKYGTLAKMNPPLRTNQDRYELIEGLKSGTIDFIATDHAPHSAEEKAKPLTEAPSGIIGLETSLAVCLTKLVRRGHMTILQLMRAMSYNPAEFYKLDAGYIDEGGPADLVIFNEDELWIPETFRSKATNSPFKGEKLHGKVKYTICAGKVVYKDVE